MTYKMTEQHQKVLTEMIGEKWHEIHYRQKPLMLVCKCGEKVNNLITGNYHVNRTFTTDPDMMKVFRWLVDSDKIYTFYDYCFVVWIEKIAPEEIDESFFIAWLFYDAERFNCLVAQCKMEGVI